MVKQPTRARKAQERVLFDTVCDEEHGHRRLREHGRDRGARNAPAQDCHQDDIQHDIDRRRQQDGQEGRTAVARPAQGSRIDVVHCEEGDADQNDAQIVPGQADGVRRGVEQAQKWLGQAKAHRGQRQKYRAQQHRKGL